MAPWNRLYILAALGDTVALWRKMQELDSQQPQPWFAETMKAYAYLELRDTVKALAALERATDNGERWATLIELPDPLIDPIRRSARFEALLRRVGLSS